MHSLIIENISPALYLQIEQEARQSHRSITQQVISLLELALVTQSKSFEPPTPIELGIEHHSEWVYAAIKEGRK